MRLKIKMLFSYLGDGSGFLGFQNRWNLVTSKQSNHMFSGAIALWKDDPDYEQFQMHMRDDKSAHDVELLNSETEAVYELSDLFESELLTVSFDGLLVNNNDSGGDHIFKVGQHCSRCSFRELVQQRDVVISKALNLKDACFISSGNGVDALLVGRAVSSGFRKIIEQIGLKGINFREIVDDRVRKVDGEFFQLLTSPVLPQLHPTTKLEFSPACMTCGRSQNLVRLTTGDTRDQELYFPRFDFAETGIGVTQEAFGTGIIKCEGNHELIMSGAIFRILIEAGVTGMCGVPAHFV